MLFLGVERIRKMFHTGSYSRLHPVDKFATLHTLLERRRTPAMFSYVRQLHEWMQQLQTGYASSAEMRALPACSRGLDACGAAECSSVCVLRGLCSRAPLPGTVALRSPSLLSQDSITIPKVRTCKCAGRGETRGPAIFLTTRQSECEPATWRDTSLRQEVSLRTNPACSAVLKFLVCVCLWACVPL